MKRGLLRLHRALGLAMAVFWLLQAVTGGLLAFRWELEDALLPGTEARADAEGLGARLESVAQGGGRATDLWATSNAATRFDIYYVDAGGAARVMRVDGAGRVLRDVPDGGYFAHGAVWDTLTRVHTQWLAGEAGGWLVAASGVLLLTSLAAGLRLAWPRAGNWRRVFFERADAGGPGWFHVWHRRLGLCLGIVILPFVVAGILLCFEDGLRDRLAIGVPVPEASEAPVGITPGTALALAAARYPAADLSALILPGDGRPWYRVRQRRPRDLPRNWGTSTLYVSAADGRILGDFSSADAPAADTLVDLIYPLHTGQVAGVAGRSLVLLQGVWLTAMITLGLQLWRKRRSPRT